MLRDFPGFVVFRLGSTSDETLALLGSVPANDEVAAGPPPHMDPFDGLVNSLAYVCDNLATSSAPWHRRSMARATRFATSLPRCNACGSSSSALGWSVTAALPQSRNQSRRRNRDPTRSQPNQQLCSTRTRPA